jgi:hypothetical protein
LASTSWWQDADGYVALAASRRMWLSPQVQRRIEASRSLLFEDAAPIRALEEFLLARVR